MRACACDSRVAPSGRKLPASSTRSSFACTLRGSSPISSSSNVPPRAASKSPCRVWKAPVKAPRTLPNSSLSTSSGGSAAQLTATKGPAARGLAACRARAAISLPVPVSPPIRTGAAARPYSSIRRRTPRIARLSPASVSIQLEVSESSMARHSPCGTSGCETTPRAARTSRAGVVGKRRMPSEAVGRRPEAGEPLRTAWRHRRAARRR